MPSSKAVASKEANRCSLLYGESVSAAECGRLTFLHPVSGCSGYHVHEYNPPRLPGTQAWHVCSPVISAF